MHKFGWHPGPTDHGFPNYSHSVAVIYPPVVDLRPKDSPIYDQGGLQNCTGNAIAGMCQYVNAFVKNKYLFVGSRLFIYYNERMAEGSVNQDAGASLVDGIISIHTQGLPNEAIWAYTENFATKPAPNVYANGLQHIVGGYFQINNTRLVDMRSCLFAGFPFVLGINIYPSFFGGSSGSTGIIPVPVVGEVRTEGHAVCCVGYDDVNQWLICRNSWGTGWGAAGYMFLPYSYVTNLNWATEFFTVRTITPY